jgi:hypothetical protein
MAAADDDGSSGQQWGRRTMSAVDDKGMQDCVADYKWVGTTVVRDTRDCWVAMMAAMVEDGGGDNDGDGGKQRWWTTKAADDNGSQDWAADYDGEGWVWAARDGGGSRVVMMDAAKMMAVEDSGGGQQQWWWRTTAVDNGSRQRWLARSGSRIQRGRSRVDGEQQWH